MFLKRNSCLLVFMMCSLTLWCKVSFSFLRPSHKPLQKGKSPRVDRQAMKEPSGPTKDSGLKMSAPFEIGITITDEDFEGYSVVLQEIIQRLLGNSETAERLSPL
ncbi:appetite-regulating hormone [Odontesthes bonariensis]|uniref:appetite-regulating hormone n=1 Tax=Odontesthes bonariensis TaxID=219752 RepID=UPI003F5843EB